MAEWIIYNLDYIYYKLEFTIRLFLMNNKLLIVIGLIVLLIIVIYNMLISKLKKIERNKSLVDIYLKKRFDLIPNLVEVCKEYSKFEKQTLEKIVTLRSSFNDNPSSKNQQKLSREYKKLIALLEKYPKLNANKNYLKLQKEIVNVENELQAARRIYINSITSYNNFVNGFPVSIIAKITGYKQIELPEFDDIDIKVNFD